MMDTLDFKLLSGQAVIFTPQQEWPFREILSKILPEWLEDRFDGKPTILSPGSIPISLGGPQISLSSADDCWHLQVGPDSASVRWGKADANDNVEPQAFVSQAYQILFDYIQRFDRKVGRVGFVLNHFAEQQDSGTYLLNRFCRADSFNEAFKAPSSFELHLREVLQTPGGLNANYWFRSRTGVIATGNEQGLPLILVEQDINTLADELEKRELSNDALKEFFNDALALHLQKLKDLYLKGTK